MAIDPEEYAPLADDERPIGEEPLIGTIEASDEWTKRRDELAQEM